MTTGGRLSSGNFPFPVSEERFDACLRAGETVLTVEVGSAATAYPIYILGDAAVDDRIAGQPIVAFSFHGLFTGAAISATVSGRNLIFRFDEGLFRDVETSSTWNLAGHAVAGPLNGATLVPLPSRRSFWFSIADAIPRLKL